MIALGQLAVRGYLTLMLAFLYLPIVIMILMAFNESALYELPFRFSLVWFKALSGNVTLWTAARNSVLLASASTVIATALGTMAALSFARHRIAGKAILRLLLFIPVTVPWLIVATAMLVFFFWVGIGRGLHAMLLAHVALSLPYVIVIVGARLAGFPMELEEAAATLGATPWQVFRRVSAPIIAPGMVAAALFAFAISFDQFATSYFLSAPGVSTLPVEIYSMIRRGFTPEINAISAIIITLSMGIMVIFSRLFRFSGAAPGE
jgi:spermidine/putrescine transport system permease protein